MLRRRFVMIPKAPNNARIIAGQENVSGVDEMEHPELLLTLSLQKSNDCQ
jgi:hypothetical protein